MKKATVNVCRYRLGLPMLALCLLAGIQPIKAQTTFTLASCDTVAQQLTDWNSALTFSQFDGTLGALLSAEISGSLTVQATARIENTRDTDLLDLSVAAGADLTLTLPNTATIGASAVIADTDDYARFDGLIDWSGASGKIIAGITQESRTVDYEKEIGGDLNDFLGTGTFQVDASVGQHFQLSEETGIANETITFAGLTSCITYTYAPSLPVELTSFTLDADADRSVLLKWTTLSETDNMGFVVQYAWEDGSFRDAGFVAGSGTTNLEQNYQFRLSDLSPGSYRFRVKQLDIGGGFAYSPIITSHVDLPGRFLLEPVYPNPFANEAQIRFTVRDSEPVEVSLYDVNGRLVEVLYTGIPAPETVETVRIDGRALPGGMYLVVVRGQSYHDAQRVVVVK